MKNIFLVLALLFSAPAMAQITLAADSEPNDKPWKNPATIAYTKAGDGTSTSTIDAYMKYSFPGMATATANGAYIDTASIATYIHRDNTSDAPRDDRGISFGYSRFIVSDGSNAGAVHSMTWTGKIAIGKTLQNIDESAAVAEFADRTKDREQIYISGFNQPAKSGAVPRGNGNAKKSLGSAAPEKMTMYYLWEAGLYSDHSSGGNGKGAGRLSGTRAKLEWNFMPLGLIAADNAIGNYGVAPVFTLAAQVQKDFAADGLRKKNTYHLYTATLTLEFDTIVDANSTIGKLKPSLNFSRSIGADLLTGRAFEGKTEISLGLNF